MAWITLFDHDSVSARLDTEDNRLRLEVSSGGLTPDYVTVSLGLAEIDVLEAAIQTYKEKLKELAAAGQDG